MIKTGKGLNELIHNGIYKASHLTHDQSEVERIRNSSLEFKLPG